MSQTAQDLAEKLSAQFPEAFVAAVEFRGEVTLKLKDAAKIADVCAYAAKPCPRPITAPRQPST